MTHEPYHSGRHRVILLSNNDLPLFVAVEAVKTILDCSYEEARRLANEAHENGCAILCETSKEQADSLCEQFKSFKGFPIAAIHASAAYHCRVSNPAGCALLDLSVLRAWPAESLGELAEQASLVVVPPSLLGDIMTIENREVGRTLLTKLLSFECVIALSIRDHLLFELLEQEPSGLLLAQRADLLLPERTARAVFETMLNSSPQVQASVDNPVKLTDCEKHMGSDDETDWEDRFLAFAKKRLESPVIKEAKSQGIKALLSQPEQLRHVLANCVKALLSDAVAFNYFYCHNKNLLPRGWPITPEDAGLTRIRFDETWLIWREVFAMAFYCLIDAIDGRTSVSHRGLNPKTAWRYVDHLWPGSILATQDEEMTGLARLLSPEVRIVREPSDIESL